MSQKFRLVTLKCIKTIRSISDCVMPRELTCTALIRVCNSKLDYNAVVPRHMDASTPVCGGCPGYQMIRWQGSTKTMNSISARHRPKTPNVLLSHYVRRHCFTQSLQSAMRGKHIPRGGAAVAIANNTVSLTPGDLRKPCQVRMYVSK